MRAVLLVVAGALVWALALASGASAAPAQSSPDPQRTLHRKLSQDMAQLGRDSGAYVLDMTTGQGLFAAAPDKARLPASVQKLYTTSAALLLFGAHARLTTSVFGTGALDSSGTWQGTLYLRGGGDPTFGSEQFDRATYRGGATVQRLASNLLNRAGIRALDGPIAGDESYFDSRRGTIEAGYSFDPYMEGSLSALAFDRGVLSDGVTPVAKPPLYAARQLVAALRGAHVRLKHHERTIVAATPASATVLATVESPSIARLVALTNSPSDNFLAEMLLKGLGAKFGDGGTSAAGAAVVRRELSSQFALTPSFDDGSGLSRDDATTPREVVSLLDHMASDSAFTDSLATAGETGTLRYEMQGTQAQGNCHGKTGTLHDVASLAGYCHAADGHTIAFAFLANGLGDPEQGHLTEADMAVALAGYNG